MKKNIVILLTLLSSYVYSQETWTIYNSTNSELNCTYLNNIETDALDNVWIGSNCGLYKFDGVNWNVFSDSTGDLPYWNIMALKIDNNDIKWIGNFNPIIKSVTGLVKFNEVSYVMYNDSNTNGGLISNNILDIEVDNMNNKWISTSDGMVFFDGLNWVNYNYLNSGLPEGSIHDFAIDNDNNLWVITVYHDYFSNEYFTSLTYFNGTDWIDYSTYLQGVYIGKMKVDMNNTLWMACDNNTLMSYNGSIWTTYSSANCNVLSSMVQDIEVDANNTIWVSSYYGIAKFDGYSWTTYNTTNSQLISDNVSDIAISLNGTKWFISDLGVIKLEDNGPGLFTQQKTITGFVYHDENSNGIMDGTENGLPGQIVEILPDQNYAVTNSSGRYFFSRPTGFYSISANPQPFWAITSDSTSYNVNVIDTISSYTGLDFGMNANQLIHNVNILYTGNVARSGFEVNYWLNYGNEGTISENGTITLSYDPLMYFISSNPAPDSIFGNQLKWNFNQLPVNANNNISLRFQMPNFAYVGDTLLCIAEIAIDSSDVNLTNNVDSLQQEIVASFDPNDKSVIPTGIGNEGNIAFGQDLQYIIRFQNTGTDSAINIMIIDTIDFNMDISSFQLLGSSHPLEYSIIGNNILTFNFDNIYLPDSNINEPESHGFVRYQLFPKNNLSNNTVILNKAYIIFDFNPPIITNEVINTYSSIILNSDDNSIIKNHNNIIIYPNPFSNSTTIHFFNPNNEEFSFKLYDCYGKNYVSQYINTNEFKLDRTNLKSGIYYFTLTHEKGIFYSGKLMAE